MVENSSRLLIYFSNLLRASQIDIRVSKEDKLIDKTDGIFVSKATKNLLVRSGIWTHAHKRGPECPSDAGQVVTLESGALDHSAIMTSRRCLKVRYNITVSTK